MKKRVLSIFWKYSFSILFIFGASNFSVAQSSIVIETPPSTNYVYDLGNDTLTSYTTQNGWAYENVYYDLDLDLNGITDLRFTSYAYVGGLGTNSYINLKAFDGTSFAIIDTEQTVGHLVEPIGPVYETDTIPIVRPYDLLDTIYGADCNADNRILCKLVTHYPTSSVLYSVDNWISGEHFIGFKKIINTVEYLGWVKVDVLQQYKMVLKEYSLGLDLYPDLPGAPTISVFPNPSNGILNVNFDQNEDVHLELLRTTGELVYEQDLNQMNNVIDLSQLFHGVYYVRLTGADWVTNQLIVLD